MEPPNRKIIEVVNKCPTQALIWKNNKDLTEEEQKSSEAGEPVEKRLQDPFPENDKPTSIRIMRDGPIVVEGQFSIIGMR